MAGSQGVQTGGVRFKQRRHLIDERSRAAGAGFVHAQFHALIEIEDLGVLSAKLHGHVGMRRDKGYGLGCGHDFLHKGQMKAAGQLQGGRTRHGRVHPEIRMPRRHFGNQGGQGASHGCAVAEIARFKHRPLAGDERQFDSGGTDVQPQKSFWNHCQPQPARISPRSNAGHKKAALRQAF